MQQAVFAGLQRGTQQTVQVLRQQEQGHTGRTRVAAGPTPHNLQHCTPEPRLTPFDSQRHRTLQREKLKVPLEVATVIVLGALVQYTCSPCSASYAVARNVALSFAVYTVRTIWLSSGGWLYAQH